MAVNLCRLPSALLPDQRVGHHHLIELARYYFAVGPQGRRTPACLDDCDAGRNLAQRNQLHRRKDCVSEGTLRAEEERQRFLRLFAAGITVP